MSGVVPANRGNRSPNRTGALVSRKLRRAGWNIAPASLRHRRDVTTVAAMGDYVSVLADTGLISRNRRIADGISAEVSSWPQAFDVETADTESGAVFIRFTYRPVPASKGTQ